MAYWAQFVSIAIQLALCSVAYSTAFNHHTISKRQIFGSTYPYLYGTGTNLAPVFPQQSYTFTGSCTAGNVIGTATATSLSGGVPYYSVDPGQGAFYNVGVNPYSGQITMCTSATGTFNFNLRAANSYGAQAVPVTVTCTSGTSTTSTTSLLYGSTCSSGLYGSSSLYGGSSLLGYPYSSGLTGTIPYTGVGAYPYNAGTINPYTYGTSYPYTAGTSYPYGSSYPYTAGSGTTSYPYGGTYPYSSGTSYPYGSTYPYTSGTTYPYSTGTTYPYGLTGSTFPGFGGTSTGVVTFSQPSGYRFSTSQCTPGSTVGTVTTTGGSGLQLVTGGSGVFAISPSGQITLTSQLYTGTYNLVVSGGSTSNQVPVTITATCSNSGFTPQVFG